ncbi:tyrosine-type recombinase/integrase [Tessaracoccus sp. MC1627]|uniref:tyrosine-type recombinase/integrase n=1 Tax=Tessaracoccus sp. MC1627 TaxID=2760312 RepID=UPI00160100D6|nr:tyrosine-type recombinase/integrase [Tessaracoccus sp. MC1627]MBB1512026.1 tyrosine-type recombinase/integrase [Tessaracoccus sp. MC1627]
MAVADLWHVRGGARCPECRTKAGAPSTRHGRGARWRVTVGDHPSRAFTVKADAEAWEASLKLNPWAGPGSTVGELLDLWLAGKRGLSPGGLEQCQHAVNRVRPVWGARLATHVERAELQAWIAGLSIGARPASQTVKAKAGQALAGALQIAVERGQLASNPARQLRYGRATRRQARFLAVGELAALAGASSWPAMVWMLGTGGYRASEALALTVGDVDPGRGRARVQRSKNGEGRDVPILPSVLAMLDLDRPRGRWLLEHPRGEAGSRDRRALRNNVVAPAAARAGLGAVTTHDLRHTAASLAIAAGADVKMVQAMLGHASATLTMDTYGHLFEGGLDGVAAKMERMISTRFLPPPL